MTPRSLFVGIGVLLAALLAWWAFAERAPAPPRVTIAAPAVDTASATEAVASPVAESERATIATSEPSTEEPEEPPGPVSPWVARFLVVDDEEQPVANASVTVWALSTPQAATQPTVIVDGEDAPAFESFTDAQGRTQAVVTFDGFKVGVHKDGFLPSGYSGNKNDAKHDIRLVLCATMPLNGIVVHEHGRPASGAEVLVTSVGNQALNAIHGQRRVTAGADGRFTLPVVRGANYNLRGELDGRVSFPERVFVTPALPEVVLRFRGGSTLNGIVVDADGKPAAMAKVLVRREPGIPTPGLAGFEHEEGKTGDDGRFSIAVRGQARYQVLARKEGRASSRPAWLRTTAAQPHAEARLELLAFSMIRGRVVRDDGASCTDLLVTARPEREADFEGVTWETDDRYERAREARPGPDGTFELAVHADTTWTVSAGPPNGEIPNVRLTGVSPGRTDVVLRVTPADVAGCVVHGTVVRGDREPAAGYSVTVVAFENDRAVSRATVAANSHGDTFTLPPLPLGRQYAVSVSLGRSAPVSPAQSPPFVTNRSDVWVVVRLEPWGTLPVRVLDAAGSPTRGLRIVANRVVNLGVIHQPRTIGPDGCAVLKGISPGAHALRVFGATGLLCEQQVLVTPGLNSEVAVHLPPPK